MLYVVGGCAVVVFFVVRQRRSDRFTERSLLFPIGLGIYGIVLLTDTSKHHAFTVASGVLLVVSATASIGFGVIRGRTIELFERGGELWERASWTTVGVGWGGLLVTRIALIGVATAIGATVAASPTSIPLMLAITLATQMIVVKERARQWACRLRRPAERGGVLAEARHGGSTLRPADTRPGHIRSARRAGGTAGRAHCRGRSRGSG